MVDLASLFAEMEAAVVTHQPAINNIQEGTDTAVTNVNKGNEQLNSAVDKARAARKKKWICLGIVGESMMDNCLYYRLPAYTSQSSLSLSSLLLLPLRWWSQGDNNLRGISYRGVLMAYHRIFIVHFSFAYASTSPTIYTRGSCCSTLALQMATRMFWKAAIFLLSFHFGKVHALLMDCYREGICRINHVNRTPWTASSSIDNPFFSHKMPRSDQVQVLDPDLLV